VTLMRKDTNTGRTVRPFNTKDLAARLERYGFTECSMLRAFILCICGDTPGPPELGYIRLKLRECLSRHDDGSAWFTDLRDAEMRASTAYCIVANVQNADGREAEAKN